MNWYRHIPFVGRIRDCSGEALLAAAKEVLVTTVFATMPLWLLPLLSQIFFVEAVTAYEAIRTGELLLFSTAFVGPLIYIISKNYGEKRPKGEGKASLLNYSIKFPHGESFVYSCVAICFVSSFAFIVLRNPLFQQTDISRVINYNGVIVLSIATFIFSAIIFFCATAYRNSLENIVRIMPSQERAFVTEWEESNK